MLALQCKVLWCTQDLVNEYSFFFLLFRIGKEWGGIGWLPVVACGDLQKHGSFGNERIRKEFKSA